MTRYGRLLAIGGLVVASAGAIPAGRYIRLVDCSNESLQEALFKARVGESIQVRGACNESIAIGVDYVTIDGMGSASLFWGSSTQSSFEAAVTVAGARGVTIRGIKVSSNGANGILAQAGSSFKLQNAAVENNGVGVVLLEGANGEIADSVIMNNAVAGIALVNSATAVFKGSVKVNGNGEGIVGSGACSLEVQGGTLETNLNKAGGISLSGCNLNIYGIPEAVGTQITSKENGTDGILIGGGQLTVFGGNPGDKIITVESNKANGINLIGFASIVNLGSGKFVLRANATGLNLGSESSIVSVGGLVVQDNGTGILADGAGSLTLVSIPPNPSTIQGNTAVDVDLRFGTRMTVGGAAIGTLKCDATVLSRGSKQCP